MRIRVKAYVDFEDGTRDTIELTHTPILVGRSPLAEIALVGARRVAMEHARVELTPEAVKLTVLEGESTGPSSVPYGMPIELGDVRITFEQQATGMTRAQWIRAIAIAAITCLIACIGAVALTRPRGARASFADEEGSARPVMFDDDDSVECDQPGDARRRTNELTAGARALREQLAFNVQDGVRAVQRFQRAAACAAEAGDAELAEDLRAEGGALRTELEDRAARLVARVRRAEQREDPEAELEALRSLLQLIAHRDDERTREYAIRARTLEANASRRGRFRLGR